MQGSQVPCPHTAKAWPKGKTNKKDDTELQAQGGLWEAGGGEPQCDLLTAGVEWRRNDFISSL